MDAKGRIRWGVLGYARIARESLIPAMGRSRNAVFHAIASRDAETLKACAERFGPRRAYLGYQALLDDPEVDAVYIPLPNALHEEWTLKAAARGKHVLCEKPAALDAAGLRRMSAACEAAGVLFMEAFMYRYTERTRLVRECVDSGALGELRFVESSFRFHLADPASIKYREGLGGGSLYDVGCYPVNFVGLFAGGAPVSVHAEAWTSGGVDVRLSALLRYADGIGAALHCGFDSGRVVASRLIGTKGVLEVPDTWMDEAGALRFSGDSGDREIPVPASDRYRAELEDFSAAILEGRCPRLELEESIANMEVLDSIGKAAGLRGKPAA